MTPERWDRIKTVFMAALDQPAGQRRAWLHEACAGDEALRAEIQELLDAHDDGEPFLDAPVQVDPADLADLSPDSSDEAPLPPGSLLADQYRVIGELGRGGMGVVYLAEDLRLSRRVALKVLPRDARHDPVRLERFRREAWAAARIAHASVATVYAFEQAGDHPFIVAEYVRGTTLRSEIARGPIEPARARRIAVEIARALCAAHEEGVVHRDLKPENVMLTTSGGVKVVDFGIASLAADGACALTREGVWLGTPAYMAPEQDRGGADARADIYSFGVVVSEMLSGRHPLAPPPAHDPPGPAPTDAVPGAARLAPILARCLQLDPSRRYPTARDLLEALERADAPERRGATPDARWWWQFHQVATAVGYWLMVAAAWEAWDDVDTALGGVVGRAAAPGTAAGLFFLVLASVMVSANLRLNLWFTSRFIPDELARVRSQAHRWVRAGDWTFALTLLAAGALMLADAPNRAFLFIGGGMGAGVAAAFIEPVTARAAFGGEGRSD
jgi:predicted Ser/Thr protein kinase